MKILHVSFGDYLGGASNAMISLHYALLEKGVASDILLCLRKKNVIRSKSAFSFRISLVLFKIKYNISILIVKLFQRTSNFTTRSLNIFDSPVLSLINSSDCDIVHLHWIGYETLSIKDVARINKNIVWTFHDNWPILGAEHVDIFCYNRFKEGYLKTNKPYTLKGVDLEKWVWERKYKHWRNKHFNIIAISRKQNEMISESPIFLDSYISTIPNLVDQRTWYPGELNEIPDLFKNLLNKRIILFGANNSLKDPNKGFQLLYKALQYVSDRNDFELVIFGNINSGSFDNLHGIKTTYLGFIDDKSKMRILYTLAYAVVVPSLQETFGLVAAEAMACGTPVIGFKISGLMDIINHLENGYLAESYHEVDLANGIKWALELKNYEEIQRNCVNSIDTRYSMNLIVNEHINYYKRVLNKC